MTKGKYEGIKWEEGMEKVLRKLVEYDSIYGGSPVAKEILKRLEEEGYTVKEFFLKQLLPGWQALLKTFERDEVSVDEMRNVLRYVKAIERIIDEAIDHLEERGRIDHMSFTALVENLKRGCDPNVVDAAAKDVLELVERHGIESLEVLYTAKKIPGVVRE